MKDLTATHKDQNEDLVQSNFITHGKGANCRGCNAVARDSSKSGGGTDKHGCVRYNQRYCKYTYLISFFFVVVLSVCTAFHQLPLTIAVSENIDEVRSLDLRKIPRLVTS